MDDWPPPGPAAAELAAVASASDHFAVLGLPAEPCAAEVVKRCYYRLALRLHPDKCRHPSAEGCFKRLGEAYELLGDGASQEAYLQRLALRGSHPPGAAAKRRREDSGEENGAGRGPSSSTGTASVPQQQPPPRASAPASDDSGSPVVRHRKSFAEMQREFTALEHAFEARNDELRNRQRAAQEARRRQREAHAVAQASGNERLEMSLSVGADDRAQGWRDFQSSQRGRGGKDGAIPVSEQRGGQCEALAKDARGDARGSGGFADSAAPSGPASADIPAGSAAVTRPRGANCLLCRRAFPDRGALALHEAKSALHKANLEKLF